MTVPYRNQAIGTGTRMSEHPEAIGSWPYFRRDPERVVLPPRPGVTPSTKPPVRIFLGTEDAQYRAERIFFWSIEKVRDPARTYEIYLMKNIVGFDRRGWRTGFTNYRFAIPDFAGRQGRAIYNDVDQIYLADPALLFDLDMAGHGYLTIDPRDTSVMLIDCEKMWPYWNRDTAARSGKTELVKRPAAVPGLCGPLDPHWNARDLEYVEGHTKCLHYTALHQQPWLPFPGDYSYHPNPLAYIWHDLEREADAAGYQLFTRQQPSPGFAVTLQRDDIALPPLPSGLPGARALALANQLEIKDQLVITAGGDAPELPLGSDVTVRLDLCADAGAWPERRFDAVVAGSLFERVPPADIAWLLDEIFARARRLVLLSVAATARHGLGSPEWWRRRVAEAAARRPGVSWHLDVFPGTVEAPARTGFSALRREDPGQPRVWALLGDNDVGNAQVRRLVAALGWPYEERRLVFTARASLPPVLLGASLAGVDTDRSSPLSPPWPDLVIAAGAKSVPAALWIRKQSGGRTRLVQLGRPLAPFHLFDLIIAGPQHRLPIRDNVLHVTAPFVGMDGDELQRAREVWQSRLSNLPTPRTALFVGGGGWMRRVAVGKAAELGRTVAGKVAEEGGSVLVAFAPDVPARAREALLAALPVPHVVADAGREREAQAAFLALADQFVVTDDDPALLAEACLTSKPVALYGRGQREESRILEPVWKLGAMLLGLTYRGTPHQQTWLGRLADELATRGLLFVPRDLEAYHDALEARGLITRIGSTPRARPHPLDDLARTVERVRSLMSELPQVG